MLDQLRALLVPPACLACRTPLPHARDALCAECRGTLAWLPETTCPRCALPRPCAPCPARTAAYDAAWSPLAHDGAARTLVAALKFRGALAAADVMAAQIAARLPTALGTHTTLVPVPAGPARRRARGFDQAEALARRLAARIQLPQRACLTRRGPPKVQQLGTSRATRRAAGRLDVDCRGAAPARVLLVDDVHTTGATLDACARALKRSGATFVGAVTYTRALP